MLNNHQEAAFINLECYPPNCNAPNDLDLLPLHSPPTRANLTLHFVQAVVAAPEHMAQLVESLQPEDIMDLSKNDKGGYKS